MPIFKTNKAKEIFNNIKQEQLEDRLTNIERMEDWEERFVDQTEQLHEVEKELKDKIEEAEKLGMGYFIKFVELEKEKNELEQRIESLEKQDESEQISLLKKTHQKEIRELKKETEQANWTYNFMLKSFAERGKKIEELEKDLEEKELLIEELEEENSELRLGLEANLDAIKLQENWEIKKRERIEDELNNEREVRQDFVQRLAKKIVENDKLTESRNEERRGREEQIRKNLKKDEMIEKLKLELHLANKPLPKTPSKFKILKEKTKSKFQNLIKKTKLQSQELIAGIEVKTK